MFTAHPHQLRSLHTSPINNPLALHPQKALSPSPDNPRRPAHSSISSRPSHARSHDGDRHILWETRQPSQYAIDGLVHPRLGGHGARLLHVGAQQEGRERLAQGDVAASLVAAGLVGDGLPEQLGVPAVEKVAVQTVTGIVAA